MIARDKHSLLDALMSLSLNSIDFLIGRFAASLFSLVKMLVLDHI